MDLKAYPMHSQPAPPSCCQGGFKEAEAAEERAYYYQLLRQGALALLAGISFMLLSMYKMLPPLILPLGQSMGLLMGTVAFMVLAYSAHDIYSGAYQTLKVGRANMDTLIALGTGAAWLLSLAVALRPQSFPPEARTLYFESALVVVGFVKLGAALELRSRRKTRSVIERLRSLQPKMARVLREGEEIELASDAVQVGDLLHVRPGEQVPVDAVITEGASSLDESMFSGESLPLEKTVGDKVLGGTFNKVGSFKCVALHVGKDQALSQILDLVSKVQSAKLPMVRLADKLAAYFVPVVILIAVVSALLWYFFGPEPRLSYMVLCFCSVLLISCPCALGLATPLAVSAGVSRAAESGILIRDGEVFGKITKLSTIVLDKTGTITEGKPRLIQIIPVQGWSERDVLEIAASLEQNSEHPIAAAFLQAAKEKLLPLLPADRFHAIPGYGLSAMVKGKQAFLGNERLMAERGIQLENYAARNEVLTKGLIDLILAWDGKMIAYCVVGDKVRADSKTAIAKFKTMGLKVIMLTGDHERTAHAIAAEVGIDEVIASVLPHEKLHKIVELKAKGETVAMVGDGINDAAALSEADVGIAIGGGTDVAKESGDMILMNSSLLTVVHGLNLTLATAWNIRENLVGAFIYNLIAIPVAAGALYPFVKILISPSLAGLLMALSSLTVVINASRLRYK